MEETLKEKGIFRAILEEHYRKPVINVVQSKRKRFSILLHAVAKSLNQDNYDKTWRLCSYLIMLLEEAEYPDEYVECPLDEIFMYLHVIYASCGAQISQNIEGCLRICSLYKNHCRVYPILYPTMIICHLKLGHYDTARSIIREGIDFVTTEFDLIKPRKYHHGEITLEYVQNMGHNSPKYAMSLFYAYGKLLDMNIEESVNHFMEQHSLQKDFHHIKGLIDSNTLRCCTGSSMDALNYLKHKLTLQNMYAVSDYTVNDLVTNHIITNFSDVNATNATSQSRAQASTPSKFLITYKINSLRRNLNGPTKRLKGVWTIGKPRQTRFYECVHAMMRTNHQDVLMKRKDLKIVFKTKILPRLFTILRTIRTDVIEALYLQLINMRRNACTLFDGLEDVLVHLIYIYNEFAVPLSKGSCCQIWTYAEPIMQRIKLYVLQVRQYIDRYEEVADGNLLFTCRFAIELKKLDALHMEVRAQLTRFSFCVCVKMHQMMTTKNINPGVQSHSIQSERYLIERTNNPVFGIVFKNADLCKCRACFYSYQIFLKRDSQAGRHIQFMPREHTNNNTHPKSVLNPKTSTKESQTNYSKFSCSNKQSQTDKRFSEEYALKKQINTLSTNRNDLINKIGELEDSIYELSESKKEILENENKMIKALKKEMADARRIIHDKAKEAEIYKNENEQLRVNLSKFSKPYSHAVKTPEEMQQNKNGNLVKLNEKLQSTNASLITENNSLHKHLAELTEEYDKMKVKCDTVFESNEDLEIAYQKKSAEFENLISKLSSFKNDTNEKFKKEQTKNADMRALIHSSVKDLVDTLLEKLNQYKVRCQRLHHEILCLFFNSSAQYSIKQTCETNQLFLGSTAGQLERNLHILVGYKAKLAEDPLMNFVTLMSSIQWKTTISYIDEVCTGMFNQYVQNLDTLIRLNTALDNAHFVNPNPVNPVMEPEKLYRQPVFNQAVGPGPVGANRPHSSTTEYQKAKAQSPIEIEDPNAKNILSQIANAVNYPSSMSPTYSMDASQGVIRRPIASRKPTTESERAATPDNYQWNQNVPVPSSMPLDCADFNCYNGKYRDIYLMVQRRFSSELIGDLVDALNYVKTVHNNNLNKLSNESIIDMVSNYILQHSKNRMRPVEVAEAAKPESSNDDICSICFEKLIAMPTYTLNCFHVFHIKCIKLWLKQNKVCPICRKLSFLE